MASSISSRWKELSGHGEGESDNWKGLLSPIDNDLRRFIVHYGERTGAVGDMFNSKERNCKSSKNEFFSKACLVKGNNFEYEVKDFFYAGSNLVDPAWFGYVAVTNDNGKTALGRRDILVVWRGTIKTKEWINNTRYRLTSASKLFGEATQAKVHSGFLDLYTGTRPDSFSKTSARKQVEVAVKNLVNNYENEEVSITVTGFSLGGALATLNAMDIVANGYNKPTGNPSKAFKVTAFVFAGPRVGDSALKQEFTQASGLRLLRITNSRDPVPKVPLGDTYVHVGDQELTINDSHSPFLRWRRGRSYDDEQQDYLDPTSIVEIPEEGQVPNDGSERTGRGLLTAVREYFSVHNMDVYLHGVAGVQNDPNRPNDKFSLNPNTGVHDYVLVNKYLNRLKPDYQIPSAWWEGENRNKMEQQANGRWKVK